MSQEPHQRRSASCHGAVAEFAQQPKSFMEIRKETVMTKAERARIQKLVDNNHPELGNKWGAEVSARHIIEVLTIRQGDLPFTYISIDGEAGHFLARGTNEMHEEFRNHSCEYIKDLLFDAIFKLGVEAQCKVSEWCCGRQGQPEKEIRALQRTVRKIAKSEIEQVTKLEKNKLSNRIGETRGAPRGQEKSESTVRYSKKELYNLMPRIIRQLNKENLSTSEDAVAKHLGLSNGKALYRLRRYYGDREDWRSYKSKELISPF